MMHHEPIFQTEYVPIKNLKEMLRSTIAKQYIWTNNP